MTERPNLIECGDTKWCDECKTTDTITGEKVDVPVHTMNEMGRCDYYRGPDHKKNLTSISE